MQNENMLLSSAVFAASITAITNLIVSLIGNRRVKLLEKKKSMDAIDAYRYKQLYEVLLIWHEYDSKQQGSNPNEIASNRLINGFLDDIGRYDIIRPLLDKRFITELDRQKESGLELLNNLIDIENVGGIKTKEHTDVLHKYFDSSEKFSKALKASLNEQMEILQNEQKQR